MSMTIAQSDYSRQVRVALAQSERNREHHEIREAVNDLMEVMRALQRERQFDKSDRMRANLGKLARLFPEKHIAQGWKA